MSENNITKMLNAGAAAGIAVNANSPVEAVSAVVSAMVAGTAGLIPASAVTAGTFGAGAYTFPAGLTLTGALTGVTSETITHGTEADLILVKTGANALSVSFYNAGTAVGWWDNTNTRSALQYDPAANKIYTGGSLNVTTTLSVAGNLTLPSANASAVGSGTDIVFGATTQTTIGANGAATALTANPLGYLVFYKGTTKCIIPYYNG